MEAPLVQIDTAMGSFSVELYYKHAPNACKNFQELAKRGYYDGTIVSGGWGDHVAWRLRMSNRPCHGAMQAGRPCPLFCMIV